jgi:translocation and assembly module TamB
VKRKLIVVAVVVCLLAALGGAFFLMTDQGLRILVGAYLPDFIEVGAVQGRAIGPVRATDIVLKRPGLSVRAEQVEFDWNLIRGLAGNFQVESLEIDSLEIELKPADMTPPDATLRDVSLSMPDATVRGFLVRSGELEWRADELRLGLTADADRIEITQLSLEAGDLALSGTGGIDGAAPHAVDLDLDWEWATPDFPGTAGTARITGTLESLSIATASSAPVEWRAHGEIFDVLGRPSWHFKVEVPEFDPATVNHGWPAALVGARFELAGTEGGVDLEGTLRLPELSFRTLTLEGSFHPSGAGVDIESFEVGVGDTPMRVAVAGRVHWTPSLEYDLTGEWEAMVWSKAGVVEIQSPAGRFDVAGTLLEYEGSLTGGLRGPAAGNRTIEGDLRAVFNGGPSHVEIGELQIRVGDGRADGAAAADWRDQPTFVADIHGERFDPAMVLGDLHGAADFDLTARAALTSTGLRGRLTLESLAGVVNDHPIAGRASIATVDGVGASADIDLTIGDGSVRAQGFVGPELDLTWDLRAPDLSDFVPGASGELHSHGRLTGDRAEPRVEVSARGFDLGWGEVSIGAIDLRVRFDVATGELGETRARIDDLRWRGRTMEQLRFSVAGSVASHELVVEVTAADGHARVRAEGGYREQQWAGQLASVTGDSDLLGHWELEEPVSVEVAGGGFSVRRGCLGDRSARICAAGGWSRDNPWRVEAALHGVELSSLAPVLPEDFEYAGRLAAEGELRGGHDQPLVGQATVDLEAVTLTQSGHDDPIVKLNTGTARLSVEEDLLAMDLGLDLAPQGRLEAHVQAGREGPDSPVNGSIRGSLSGLDFLTLLFPGLLDVTGELVMDLELDGTVAAPSYAGHISLVDGAAGVIAAGITLEDMALDLHGDAGGVNLSGHARSGEGQVTLSGSASWSDGEPRGRFELNGERFRCVGLPAVRVDASPDLELVLSGRDLELTGQVRIDSARIEPVDLSQAVSTSPDEIIVGETPPEPERWRVSSRIAVTLGDDITIDGYGLKGSIRGSLEIVDLPGKPAAGTGELAIEDGFFKAYGRSLDIERGRLSFGGGPLGNPALDIRAVRRFETVTAGVEVRGPATDPQITVFSDPPRPRQYALAMLVMGAAPVELGRPSDTLAYGSPSEQLDQSFGLGGAAGGLPSSLGTYLSPDFYMGYLEQINLRWRVSRRFTIEVSRGVETRLGIVYSRR